MSRHPHLPLALVLVAGVVIAQAQDNRSAPWQQGNANQDLGTQLQSVGRMVTAEYQSAGAPKRLGVPGDTAPLRSSKLMLVAANGPVGQDGLHSVLVRPGQTETIVSPASPPAVTEDAVSEPAARTAMLPSSPIVRDLGERESSETPLEDSSSTESGLRTPPAASADTSALSEPPVLPGRRSFTPPTATYEPLITPRTPIGESTSETNNFEQQAETDAVPPAKVDTNLVESPSLLSRPLASDSDEGTQVSSRRSPAGDDADPGNSTLQLLTDPTEPAGGSPLPLDRSTLGTGLVGRPLETATRSAVPGILATSTGPLLRVETKGPKAVTLGEPAEFVVNVSNPGTADADNVTVHISLPEHVKLVAANSDIGAAHQMGAEQGGNGLEWILKKLSARSNAELILKAVPQANQPFQLGVDWSIQPLAAAAEIQVQQPMLEILVQGPEQIVYGDSKIYSIVLSNPGTGDAKNVTVNLALGQDQADTLDVGTIPAGKSQKYDVEIAAQQAGVLQVVAVASADNDLSAQVVQQISVLKADLQLEALGSRVKYAGSVGTYQVRVANKGNATAEDVRMQVQLPLGAKYFQGLTDASQSGEVLSWNVGSLGPGQEQVSVFYCHLEAAGDAKFQFAATGQGGLQALADATTRVETLADLKLSVNDPKGPLPVGDEVSYEIQIVNRGSKAATGVNVVAQFSDGIEPTQAQGAESQIVPGQVVFAPIERVEPNETVVLTVKAKAEADGNHLFRAEVRCGDPETRLVAEDTTQYFARDMFEPTSTVTSTVDRSEGFVPVGSRP